MIKQFKLQIIKFLNNKGYQLIKRDNHPPESMYSALERLSVKIRFESIIDLGAAKGGWTQKAINFWPNAKYFLFEPLEVQIKQAQENLKESRNIKFIESAVGEESGSVHFNIGESLDGSGIYEDKENSIEVKLSALDDFEKEYNEPLLLKLDTHGFEQPILAGASKTLMKTQAILMEVYGFDISPTARRFPEMCSILEGHGFRLWDIVDIMRRPKDQAFWQADAVFLKADHPVFSDNSYK